MLPDQGRCVVHALGGELSLRDVVALVQPAGEGPADAQVDAEWDRLLSEGRRLFDGPLVFVDVAPSSPAWPLVCRRGGYKELATAHALGRSVRALGVQGLVLARDQDGDECLLMGRRGSTTRVYANLWENAPSGTLAPPARIRDAHEPMPLELSVIIDALRQEADEELGESLGPAFDDASIAPAYLLDDPHARSLDFVLTVTLAQTIDSRAGLCRVTDQHAWEYSGTVWVPTSRLSAWVSDRPEQVSPPTAALVRTRWG